MGSLRRTNFEKPLTSRPVPNDAESLWERTDNFVPAIPTAFEQEPELTIFVEENEAEQVAIIIIVIIIVEQVAREPEAGRILVFLKLYDPVSLGLFVICVVAIIIVIITIVIIIIIVITKVSEEITDVGKIFPNCQTEGDSGPVWGLGLRSLALQVTLMMSGDG